ncbi:hypothetical protein [Gordonia sp. WA4-43]|uniref:hypothetical protein n=1 Tax=Gordonia sp. WA4-43 TaxID=2878678 RepID=UPI001CFBEC8F|nr:hypothetical protein [Gordonia sp. WA4-43]UCZ88621.1 hypothetical protein LEL84_16245 [Gordonia sp. WA4-43]
MARDYAQIRLDIWTDDDFRRISPAAQHLYFVLLTSPTLSYCGVADWRPGRIAAVSAGWSAAGVRMAAAELVDGLFIVIDEDTEEVLVRSFVKHDGLLRNPKTSVSMANAYASVASKMVRGVIIHQLQRLRSTQPDLKAWDVSKVVALLDRESIDPADLVERSTLDLPEDYPQGLPVDLPQGLGEGLPQALPVDLPVGFTKTQPEGLGVNSLPAPAPAPTTSSNGGYVSGERHQHVTPDPNDPPPRTCPRHPDGTDAPCRGCAAARRQRETWDHEHDPERQAARARAEAESAAARHHADTRLAEVDACDLCDDHGYRRDHHGLRGGICDHNPDRDAINARGRERLDAVRAQMAAAKAAKATPEPEQDPEP